MANDDRFEGFTLKLALADAVPVLFFGGSCIVLGLLFGRPLFLAGAVLMFLAGLGKVLWKLLLAVKKKEIPALSRQFRCVMPAGFFLIVLSLILNAKSLSLEKILAGVTGFPSCVFFILGFCGMIAMGVLGKKLDQSKARNNWIEQCTNAAAQGCIFLGLLFLL